MSESSVKLDFGPAVGLICRECSTEVGLGARHVCAECFGPLEVKYNFQPISREQIEAGPRSIWRYAALLPVPADAANRPADLSPGFTRLQKSVNLAQKLGMKSLWIKDDRDNPTHSFKDRVVAVAMTAGQTLGFKTISCASTGNLANAVAAAAARAGVRSVVLIPDNLELGKVVTSAVYGTTLVGMHGNYDDVNRPCSAIADDRGYGFVNVNLRPYYAEGSKTLGYEIAEQLGWRLPDQVVVPIASGSLMTKIDKAFEELIALGLVEAKPYRIFGAQATGCNPVAEAFEKGWDVVRPMKPNTIAKSLAIGNPADGPYAIDVANRTGSSIGHVSDAQVVEGIKLLAETEGIFSETAGGVTVANLKQFIENGALDPNLETVLLNTGDGLKTLEALTDSTGFSVTIPPTLEAFRAAVPE
jgi:threonine synthase